MRAELVFQLLKRVGPFERFGRLIVASDEVEDRLLQLVETGKMVGLEELALQQTEPDFDLIEPRGVFREPIQLQRDLAVWLGVQFVQPAS